MARLLLRLGRLRSSSGPGMGERLRRPGRPAVGWTLRLTGAAMASYVAAGLVFPGSVAPLLAPLTALLVVQLTPVSLLASGLDRIVSVVAGVSLAVLLSSTLGLTWWSLGLLIGISLVAGQVLRLGANLLEVPISAMLVFGVGAAGAETAAGQRITETLVGAAVGVLSNLVFPPRVIALDAGEAIQGLAEDFARLLDRAGEELASEEADSPWLAHRAQDWLGQARLSTHRIPDVGAVLLRAEESRRLNLRALGRPDSGPGLRQGMESLEHSVVAVRSMFASLEAATRRRAEDGQAIDPQARAAIGLALHDLARALSSFGHLVRQESRLAADGPDSQQVRAALDGLHEARARLIDLLLINPADDPALGQIVAVLLNTVERLLRELDLDERVRRQSDRRPPEGPRLRPQRVRIRRPPEA